MMKNHDRKGTEILTAENDRGKLIVGHSVKAEKHEKITKGSRKDGKEKY
jgi:hypothetical protein